MDSYTITIAPNDDSGAATRLVVDTSGDRVLITDVHLHAPHGLSSGHIPTVDFGLLLRAVTGTVTASNGQSVPSTTALTAPQQNAAAIEAAVQPDERPTPSARRRRTSPATPRAAAKQAARPARTRTAAAASADATAPRRPARATTTATTRTVKQAPAKTAGKARTAKKPTATQTAARAKNRAPARRPRAATKTAAASTPGRVYRRTPDDLATVFRQVQTVAGIAAHYEVPRYTAQGWVSRLRARA
jgi:hypothetical protein